VKGREEILKVHTRKTPLSENVNLSVLSRGTPGFTGADLENLVNEAALLAARLEKSKVEMADFEASKDKVLMGVERRTMIISDEEKRLTAYHEAGHTLVAKFLPRADPIHKVTIIPRGRALGITQQLPAEDKHTLSKEYIINKIAIFLGGRAAEELVLQTQTTGAGNDLEMATEWARKMVCDFGMSEKMGPLTFGKKEEHIFLGREIAQHKDFSEKTAVDIDTEIKRIVLENYDRAKDIITQKMDKLHRLASALLEKEVLAGEEVDEVLGINPPRSAGPPKDLITEGRLL
jgi:cell division protease FtsH